MIDREKLVCARALRACLVGLALAACSDDGGDGMQAAGMSTGGTGGAGAEASGGAAGVVSSGGMTGSAGVMASGGAGGAGGVSAGAGGSGGAIHLDGGLADADTPDADTVAPRAPAHTLDLPTVMESGGVEPWFNVYRPMDLDATGEPLPVIVWANGGCFRSDFTWAPLFERWAAGGFVVLALTEHPVNGALAQTTAEEQGQLIDWALQQADAEGMYQGKLDKDRIVAAGNSCGGVTALGLTAEDERVASVFVLSGSSAFAGANTAVMSAIKVPVGYVVGGPEDIAGANATADYEALAADVPAMIISRNMGDHMTVSTDTMILPEVAEMALNWMDLTLYGTPEAAAALTSATVCEGCTAGTWSLEARLLDTLDR
jgi:dienelactone hydrolase